jgi:hypothetical protein
MEAQGALVLPYRQKILEAFGEVLAKDWPEPVRARKEATAFPFLVIIAKHFEPFDPGDDPSAIVWFEDLEDRSDGVWKVLDAIARRVQRGDDLFACLRGVEAKAARAAKADQAAGLGRYVDVAIPVIPGFVSIRAGAILADALRRLG